MIIAFNLFFDIITWFCGMIFILNITDDLIISCTGTLFVGLISGKNMGRSIYG